MAGSMMTWKGIRHDWVDSITSAIGSLTIILPQGGQNEIAQGRAKRRPGFPYSVVDK